jgi:peptidoglycan/xylan/chitin deacetylase (PgdA/CDA1 family)
MKKAFFTVIALLGMAAGAWFLSRSTTLQLFGQLVARVETSDKLLALTFDDGPTHFGTDAILQVLSEQGVRATFFLVGEAMQAQPALARRMVDAGHQVGNHSWSHQRMVLRSPEYVAREIEQTNQQIRDIGFTGPIVFRPPYGKKLLTLPWYLARHDITTVTWDVDADYDPGISAEPEVIAANVINLVQPGSIVLMHVMFRQRANSLAAVPLIIAGLRQRGYEFVTVSELLAHAGEG